MGYCSLSGVLLREIFQNWASKFRPQIWERVGICAVSHSVAIWSVVHMSAFFLGIRPAF